MEKSDLGDFKLKCVYLENEQIQKRLKEIAAQIDEDYKDSDSLVFVCVLKSAFAIFSDLLKYIHNRNLEIDFITVASYNEEENSTGNIQLKKDVGIDLRGKNVVIIEDILDTGTTIKWLKSHFKKTVKASSVKTFVFIKRIWPKNKNIDADYIGFEAETEDFFVGYGFDSHQKYRHLNLIGTISK